MERKFFWPNAFLLLDPYEYMCELQYGYGHIVVIHIMLLVACVLGVLFVAIQFSLFLYY